MIFKISIFTQINFVEQIIDNNAHGTALQYACDLDADNTVTFQNSITMMNNLISNNGSDISLVTFDGKNHETASLPSVLGMIEWFDIYKNQID